MGQRGLCEHSTLKADSVENLSRLFSEPRLVSTGIPDCTKKRNPDNQKRSSGAQKDSVDVKHMNSCTNADTIFNRFHVDGQTKYRMTAKAGIQCPCQSDAEIVCGAEITEQRSWQC